MAERDGGGAPLQDVDVVIEAAGERLLLDAIHWLRSVADSVVGAPDPEWSHPDAEAASRFLDALHDRIEGGPREV